jgi:hypothetical protein
MPRIVVRLAWFAGLWLGGALAVGVMGYAIKLMLKA